MKTFTNLAHWALKKCASLGTTNRNRYYLFSIIMLLTLGVGNAWAAESLQVTLDFTTNSWGFPNGSSNKTATETTYTSGDYSIILAGGGNGHYFNSDGYLMLGKSGATLTLPAFDFNTTKIVVTGRSGASSSVIQNIYVGSNAVSTETTGATGTNTYTINAANQAAGNVYILKVTSAHNTQITQIEVYGESNSTEPPTPATQYTIKWHTAKGVTTDVTLNEGATITKPATDPTMTGYEFMGWTDQCNVATDGAGFTPLTNFGTADSDKDFYAVFAVAETTGGGGTTTETLKGSDLTYSGNNGYVAFTATTASGTWSGKANYNTGGYIQINKNANNYHIGSPTFAGNVESVKITTTNNSATNRTFYIRSSNTTAQPTSGDLGSFKTTTTNQSFTIDLTTETKQFYIYSSGAVYISQIDVTYGGGSTSYNNYITTCSGSTPVETLTDAQFAWSAATAEATMGATNTFPTLTNTVPVSVTYESSNTSTATIAADGTITLVAPGTTTISAKFAGGEVSSTTYAAKTVTYALTVLKAPATPTSTVYVKVTSTAGITDGEYLIVYEDASNATPAPVAFDGSLTTLDAVSNNIAVTITDGTIAGNTDIDAATFTIDNTAGTLKSASGKYIGVSSNSNGLKTEDAVQNYKNAFSIDGSGNAVIAAVFDNSAMSLRYNSSSNNGYRFRYYQSGQQPIALYKKASKHTVTIADCTNGTVSAKMGETALATNDQVLSGIQITLSNEAAAGYKLAAYDVYKTDDATTKVTETDGKFIMPEFDVTISATFELAKTLTGIVITTPATQTIFWQTETFNHDGLKVTAHFDGAEDEDVTDKVTVTGSTDAAGSQTVTVSFKEGEITKDATYTITVNAIPNTKETAYTVADAFDIIDKLGDTDKMYITGFVSQADLEQSSIEQYKNADYWISADGTTNGQQLEAFRGKYLDNTDFTSVNQIMVGDEVIIYGKLTKYGSTYEFAAGNYLVSLKRDKQQPEISYTTTEYNVNLGDEFTAPTLNNPHSLAVTYSSNNEDVATVAADGAVTIKAAGTVVITASFAGNEDYVAGEASYTINITDPSISEATFVAGTDKSEELSISKNGVTVEFTGGTFSRDDNYRCYAKQSMTISYNDGQITKIVLVKSSDNSKTPSNFTTEQGTYAYAGSEGVWTGEAKSVTFETTTQVQMNTITVYYKQDTRTAAGLEWSPEAINLTIGDAFTAPTFSNPNSLNVNFDSDNTTLATVSNTGVISLNAGVTGTAVITASYEGDATYKDAAVTCTITVNPKTETVVILAQYNGQWYALKNVEETAGKVLAALPVNYVGGKLYNVEEADKATIEWQRAAVTDGIIFKNGENYISGTAGDTDLKLSTTECAWTLDGTTYKLGNRTFFYNETANGFKNYNTSNAGNSGYSNLPVVTAPVYGTGTITPMENLTPQMYGTICLENNVVGYEGITFYEVAGKEDNKVIFDEVTELVAGMPYIYIADSETATIVKGNETAAEAGYHKSLQGTFTQIDPAESNILTGNYILYNNVIKKCGKNCGLKDHKAYFIASVLEGLSAPQAQMPGRRRVSLNTTGENAATGIGDVVVPTEQATKTIINGQLIIIRDGEKFNAQGQKL